MKKRRTLLIAMILMALAVAACGGNTAAPSAGVPATALPPTVPQTVDLPPTKAAKVSSAYEDFFAFCVTAAVSRSVTSTGTAGVGSNSSNICTTWAAGGDACVLDLPLLLGAGKDKITVALTRIAAYNGPGAYELKAQATGSIPDVFPTIEVAGRTFSNGAGSSAVVTVAADGSGSVQAKGLVELASIQVSNPDPSARVDFSMQWICQKGA